MNFKVYALLLATALCQFAYATETSQPTVLTRSSSIEPFKLASPKERPKVQDKGILWYNSHLSSFSSGSSRSSRDTFAIESMAIFLNGNSPELMPIALKLIKRFEILNPLLKITLIPNGTTMTKGLRQPDCFISLRIETGDQPKVHLAGGTSFLGGFNNYNSSLFSNDNFNFSGEIEFSNYSVSLGSTEKTRRIKADKAAEKLSENIIENFNKRLKTVPFRAQLPESFYPKYREMPDFDFFKEHDAKMLMSTSGLLIHNTSNLIFDTEKSPQVLLSSLLTKLKKEGWKKERLLLQDEGSQYLRMINKEKGLSLNIAQANDRLSEWFAPLKKSQYRYDVVYQDYCTRKEAFPIITNLLETTASADQLVMCMNYLRDNRRDFSEQVTSCLSRIDSSSLSPEQLMKITDWYCSFYRSRKTVARDYYIRAKLNHMWRGKQEELDTNYAEQFDFAEALPSDIELPFSLNPKEKKLYEIKDLADVLGKEFELKVGEAFPMITSLTSLKSYCVYSQKSLNNHRAYFYSEAGLKKPGSRSWRTSEVKLDQLLTDKFSMNDVQYLVEIKINKNGKTYKLKLTKE